MIKKDAGYVCTCVLECVWQAHPPHMEKQKSPSQLTKVADEHKLFILHPLGQRYLKKVSTPVGG